MSETPKLCPAFMMARPNDIDAQYCIAWHCAWWNDGECAILSIGKAVTAQEMTGNTKFMPELYTPAK